MRARSRQPYTQHDPGPKYYFSNIQGEDNVKYWFISDWANVQQFVAGQSFMQYKQGDVMNDAVRMSTFTGKVCFMISNDNIMGADRRNR